MQSKRYRIAALVLALLLVLSFGLVMFAGCADDQEKDGDTSAGENAAAKLVTDESLKSKLLALYDFEESDKDTSATLYGYDPFTGEANGRDGYYSSEGAAQTASIDSLEDSVEGSSSKTAFNVTSGITLNGALDGLYSDNTTKGASVSFWAYNYDMSTRVSDEDAETLAVDRYNIVTNSLASLTWGTLYGTRTQNSVALNIYPSYKNGNTVVNVGRGAYKVAVLSIQYAHIAIPKLLPRCVRQIAAIGVWKIKHRSFRQCAKIVGEDIGNGDDARAGSRLGGF